MVAGTKHRFKYIEPAGCLPYVLGATKGTTTRLGTWFRLLKFIVLRVNENNHRKNNPWSHRSKKQPRAQRWWFPFGLPSKPPKKGYPQRATHPNGNRNSCPFEGSFQPRPKNEDAKLRSSGVAVVIFRTQSDLRACLRKRLAVEQFGYVVF